MNQEYEAKFKVGDKIRLYGKETTIRGFYISYNDALNKYETIMLTDGRGDPFERSLDAIEWLDENINQEGSLKDSDWKEKYELLLEENGELEVKFEECEKVKMFWCEKAMEAANQRIELQRKVHELENVLAPLLQKECKGDDLVAEQRNIITEMLAVYNKFVHAINNSNMKGTILHVELKTVVKKAEQYAKRK